MGWIFSKGFPELSLPCPLPRTWLPGHGYFLTLSALSSLPAPPLGCVVWKGGFPPFLIFLLLYTSFLFCLRSPFHELVVYTGLTPSPPPGPFYHMLPWREINTFCLVLPCLYSFYGHLVDILCKIVKAELLTAKKNLLRLFIWYFVSSVFHFFSICAIKTKVPLERQLDF